MSQEQGGGKHSSRIIAIAVLKFDWPALGALCVAMLLWGGTFAGMKEAQEEFHPFFATFARLSGSALLLLPFLRGWVKKMPYRQGDWRYAALLVLCEPCLYFVFESQALQYTTSSQAGMVTALLPLLVGVAAFFILGERQSRHAWIGFSLAVGGVIWLSLAGEETKNAPNPILGNTLEFFAMLMATGYALCARHLARYNPFFIASLQALGGAVFFGILFSLTPSASFPTHFPVWESLMLLYLALASVIAYGCFNFGIARLGAGQATASINLIPVVALLIGVLFMNEKLNFSQGLSLIPILTGVLLSLIKRHEPQPQIIL